MFKRDIDYIVKDEKVIIIDEFTGRMMDGRRWSDGLRQAVEAKEGVDDRAGEPDARLDHLPELLPHVPEAVGHDRHGDDRGPRILRHLQDERGRDSDQRRCARVDEDDEFYKSMPEKFAAIAKETRVGVHDDAVLQVAPRAEHRSGRTPARRTAVYQTLESACSTTLPTRSALGATQAESSTWGTLSSREIRMTSTVCRRARSRPPAPTRSSRARATPVEGTLNLTNLTSSVHSTSPVTWLVGPPGRGAALDVGVEAGAAPRFSATRCGPRGAEGGARPS